MTALETITLASRLKVGQSNHETLSQLQDALNINGNQNIARLKMSVIQESSDKGTGSLNSLGQQRTSLDPRVGHAPKDIHEFDSDNDDEAANWDVDFFPSEAFEIGRGRRVSKKTHTFGTAENFRVGESNEHTGPQEDEDVGFERARRRAAGSPLTRRLVLTSKSLVTRGHLRRRHCRVHLLVFRQDYTEANGVGMLTDNILIGQKFHCSSQYWTAFLTYTHMKRRVQFCKSMHHCLLTLLSR